MFKFWKLYKQKLIYYVQLDVDFFPNVFVSINPRRHEFTTHFK